jgi:hypothetical protein
LVATTNSFPAKFTKLQIFLDGEILLQRSRVAAQSRLFYSKSITRMASSQSRVSSLVDSSKSLLQKLSTLEISAKAKAAAPTLSAAEASGANAAPTTTNIISSTAVATAAEAGDNVFDLSLSDCKSTNGEVASDTEQHNHNADLIIRLDVLNNETRELKSKLEKLGINNRFKVRLWFNYRR